MLKLFSKGKSNDDGLFELLIDYAYEKKAITDFAIETVSNKIADVIASCGFKVYTADLDKQEVEYTLNVRPNINQNAIDFWRVAIKNMIEQNQALIVNINGELYLSDSFEVSNNVMKERIYNNVSITSNGNAIMLNRTFKENEVLMLRHENERLKFLTNENAKLIESVYKVAINGFKTKVPKIKVKIDGNSTFKDANGNVITSNEYVKKVTDVLTKEEVYGFMSANGVEISTLDMKCSLSSEDIIKLKNNIYETVSIAFGIPTSVFYGAVTEKSDANNEFITYACKSIIKEIEACTSFSFITKEKYLKGDRILINTLNVKHIDVIESAGNLDKLYQNGWSHNEVLELIGLPPINEEWANERRYTKNYASTEELLKGGE